jgi:hypothetical protein
MVGNNRQFDLVFHFVVDFLIKIIHEDRCASSFQLRSRFARLYCSGHFGCEESMLECLVTVDAGSGVRVK